MLLEVQDCSMRFPNQDDPLFEGVSFGVKKGEVVALMGHSGAGKSTLLHICAGLITPSNGTVLYNGKNVHKFSKKRQETFLQKDLGLLFQAFHVIPTLSVEDNVALQGVISAKGVKKDEVHTLLRQVGLYELRDSMVSSLSGGQKQRVAIARALIGRPTLMLVDEPTGSLDSETGQSVLKLLSELAKKHHVSVLFVTHEAEYLSFADRVLYLKNGAIKKKA